MKRTILLLIAAFFSLSGALATEADKGALSTEADKEVKPVINKQRVRLNLRAGVGAFVDMGAFYTGISENLACMIEIPISKKHTGWKLNTGIKFINKNMAIETARASMFMFQLPIVFSYDFRMSDRDNLRLNFGVFYEQYLDGGIYEANELIDNPIETILNLPYYPGITIGLNYYYRNFFFGIDLDMMFDYGEASLIMYRGTPMATFGYRF